VAAVTPQGTTGAGVDLLRRLGLKACASTALRDVYAAFFPPAESRLNFRPDTSCSDTTFIGSSTDMSALAAQLLHGALVRLNLRPGRARGGSTGRSLSIVRLSHDDELKAALVALDLPADRIVADHSQTYEVRVDEAAMETIREYVRASVNGRINGTGVTAGLLLGQFDSACRVAWVSQATGLPPESTASPLKIDLNRDDVRDFLSDQQSRSGGMLSLIGFWHSHRASPTAPSRTDVATMRETAASPKWHPPSVLLLELTVPEDRSVGESGSTWLPGIHAETFAAEPAPA
jgi:proteasome lid subunit RPN8/RPN11